MDETPATLLAGRDVGQQFCNTRHCIVSTASAAHRSRLQGLEEQGLISLEPLPDAHRLFFQQSTYDSQTRAFDRDFPGRLDRLSTSLGLFAITFRSYPEVDWLNTLREAGLTPLEPIPTMGYYVFGPRSVAIKAGQFPFVYDIADVPAGLKRFNIDPVEPGDGGEPRLTVVTVVAARRDLVVDVLRAASGSEPVSVTQSGPLETLTAELSQPDALTLSLFPEVISVNRGGRGGPSDERANRVIGGTWQTIGTSWPPATPAPVLPSNAGSPHYWDNYLVQYGAMGLSLSNQKIAFLDTGIDSGLQRGQTGYCPPFLQPPNYPTAPCLLVFTTDATTGFNSLETRGDDPFYHGTLTSSIAAGFAGTASAGRDLDSPPSVYGGYAFTQGVAQGAKVAMCKFWVNRLNTGTPGSPSCLTAETYRTINGTIFDDTDAGILRRLNYALVELSSSSLLPDGVTGPGARLFNHSWNMDQIRYEGNAQLLDRTTRGLSEASFVFDNNQGIAGPRTPGLHVVSAGNIGAYYANSPQVTAPGTAKNVITVGGTENYNQEAYASSCGGTGASDNPHQIYSGSRIGFPNQRLKPDVVAPATASYGRATVEWNHCPAACNMDLDGSGQYAWSIGTSFAAPIVSGAAAMVSEWLKGWSNPPSPALVKAAIIATAQSLTRQPVCGVGCSPCCAYCGDMRPSPDKYQGWGGVALDHLFGAASNYYFYDQGTAFTANGQSWSHTLTIADATKDTNLALVWSDRFSADTNEATTNLVNDLDLSVTYVSSGITHRYYGNNYYSSIDSCSRDGYSLLDPAVVYDRKNNVERINIRGNSLPAGVTSITVTVSAFSLTGDGVQPWSDNSIFRQDFALGVENAR